MHDEKGVGQILRAGGIAPHRAKLPKEERAGAVGTRAYEHAALPGRVVVCISTEAMAPGVDVEMETLGFGPPRATDKLGWLRYRALGFPGWALVNDPSRARFALDVMKEFKKAAARVKSKPGHARDAFIAIGDKLARSVPHFLPSFWEEAGRAFLGEDATSFAAQAFEKARDAEKAHALAIDEEVRGAVFLEFALAGAVSAKTLSAYAKVLEQAFGPQDGYARFAELARRRTLGGMPPWTGMAKDLRAAAKAAKLDQATEDRRFLQEVVGAQAIAASPSELWTTYKDALISLAKSSPDVRDRVRRIFPKPPRAVKGDSFHGWWIELVESAGALDAVTETQGDEAGREAHGMTGAWLEDLLTWAPGDPLAAKVLARIADRLKLEGVAVQVARGSKWYSHINLDVCEVALALGVPLHAPPSGARFALEGFTCDPVHVAEDDRFKSLLADAVGGAMGQGWFEAKVAGKRGLVVARKAWVDARVMSAVTGTLGSLTDALTQLEQRTSAVTFAEFPEARAELMALAPKKNLARQLRGGHFDEFTWPAMEAAETKLGKSTVGGLYPFPIVYNATTAIVLGPEGPLLEHELRLPPKATIRELFYAPAPSGAGQMLLAFWDPATSKSRAYWTGDPGEVFDWESDTYYDHTALPVPGGGVTFGARVVLPGDTRAARHASGPVSDGARFWIREVEDQQRLFLREYDPLTGQKGERSWPSILEGAGDRHVTQCTLRPLPAGLASSPLGSRDGLCGLWAHRDLATGCLTVMTLDGRRWDGVVTGYERPVNGLLAFPGDDRPREIRDHSHWSRLAVYLADPDGHGLGGVGVAGWLATAWTAPPPSVFWHFLRPRDEKGSRALRAISDDVCGELIEIATREIGQGGTQVPETEKAVLAKLPELTAPALRSGVAQTSAHAARVALAHAALVKSHAEATPQGDALSESVGDAEARPVLSRYIEATWGNGSLSRAMGTACRFLGGDTAVELPATAIAWESLAGAIRGLAVYAASAGASPDDRELVKKLLRVWRGTCLATDLVSMRVVQATMTDASPFMRKAGERPLSQWLCAIDASRYFVRVTDLGNLSAGTPRAIRFVERTTDGTFRAPPGTTLVKETRFSADRATSDQAWIDGFLAALDERGPVPFSAAAAEALAAKTGLIRSEAILLWAGLPKVDDYSADFLGKELRTVLDLKVSDAKAARDTFRGTPIDARLKLANATAPADPVGLWSPLEGGDDSPVTRLADAWIARAGARVRLREDVVLACEKEIDPPHGATTLLAALVDPASAACLKARDSYDVALAFAYTRVTPTEAFSHTVALSMAQLIPYVFSELPVGDAYRTALSLLYDVVRARILDPRFVAPLDSQWGEREANQAIFSAIGGDEVKLETGITTRDTGLIFAELAANQSSFRTVFRPARVKRYVDEPLLMAIAKAKTSPALSAIAFLIEECPAFIDRVKTSPLKDGEWEANPAVSAPATVGAVRAKYKLSAEEAALYLMVLTLAEPTQKNVLQWTGWKPAQYKKLADALVEKELCVPGKRERAGREIFLPGGWDKMSGRDLPMESWKKPLYTPTHGAIGRTLAPRPLHAMFEAAWARVVAGDAPKFEEV